MKKEKVLRSESRMTEMVDLIGPKGRVCKTYCLGFPTHFILSLETRYFNKQCGSELFLKNLFTDVAKF